DRAIEAARGEVSAIAGKGQSVDDVLMPFQLLELVAGDGIPQADYAVKGAGGQRSAVGGESDAGNGGEGAFLGAERAQLLSLDGVVNDNFAGAAGRQRLAVLGISQGSNRSGILELGNDLGLVRIPQPDHLIAIADGQGLAVGGEGHGQDFIAFGTFELSYFLAAGNVKE